MRLRTLHELDESEGTVELYKEGDDNEFKAIVLVPRPSENDPNDPLRWSRWKKNVAFASVCAFTFLTNYAIGGLASAFYVISLEFGKTTAETSQLLIWPILVLGVFNFFWVPMANYFGKRPVFVFASLLLTAAYIWGAVAGDFNSLLWSNIVAAFAGSSSEALGASIVNDLFFFHERSSKMSMYMNAIAGGNTIGPLFCAFTIQGLSWRWHKWIAAILTGINFLAVVFFVPETSYGRDEQAQRCSAKSPAALSPPRDSSRPLASQESRPPTTAAEPADSIPQLPKMASWGGFGGLFASPRASQAMFDSKRNSNSGASCESQGNVLEVPKNTYRQELSLWNGVPADKSLVKMFLRPLPLLAYPCVVYAFLAYAVSLVVTVAVNILNSFVLQAPPYSWSPLVNGLINIAGFVGNLCGAFVGGWVVDRFSNWRARKHKGICEPESRLWLLIFPVLITGAGCVVFGYGVQLTLHWTSLFFGYGMVGFSLTAVPTMTMTYMSDCVLPVNADVLMLVNGLKNIVAFGFLYGIIPWAETAGYVNCFGTQAGIFAGVVGIGAVLMIGFGAQVRHVQASWRIIL